MNKHQSYDLVQMQSLPLEGKIILSRERIRAWYEYYDGNIYVSRSRGKDSDVVGHLVKQMYPDVPQIFVNTGLEFDSVRKHAMEECDTVLRPEKSFVQIITEYGYPVISKTVSNNVSNAKEGTTRYQKLRGEYINKKTGEKSKFNCKKWGFLLDAPFRVSDKCCDFMKKKPSIEYEKKTGLKPILGLMADESQKRKVAWMKTGCNAFEKERPQSQPIAFWTEKDVLEYIKRYDVQIADVYGDIVYVDEDGMEYDSAICKDLCSIKTTGESRTGCVFCMFGITKDTDRFVRLKKIDPKKYDYIMRGGKFDEHGKWIPHNGLGYKFVIDWLNEHGNMNINY